MTKILPLLAALICAVGCNKQMTKTLGESSSGFTYVPIDPLPVDIRPGKGCPSKKTDEVREQDYSHLLESLPDNAVRISLRRFEASGSVSFGRSSVAAKGESYRITVDYINADTVSEKLWIAKWMQAKSSSEGTLVSVGLQETDTTAFKAGSEQYQISRTKPDPKEQDGDSYVAYQVPLYVGIGLRLTADVAVVESKTNISGLGVIGAEAEAGHLRGSLVVQTLGVNGQSIAAALPIQSELNRTTVQNAVVAVGSIKALLYDEETRLSPRVVGIYLPFPGGQEALVNQIVAELSREEPDWKRPCKAREGTTAQPL